MSGRIKHVYFLCATVAFPLVGHVTFHLACMKPLQCKSLFITDISKANMKAKCFGHSDNDCSLNCAVHFTDTPTLEEHSCSGEKRTFFLFESASHESSCMTNIKETQFGSFIRTNAFSLAFVLFIDSEHKNFNLSHNDHQVIACLCHS